MYPSKAVRVVSVGAAAGAGVPLADTCGAAWPPLWLGGVGCAGAPGLGGVDCAGSPGLGVAGADWGVAGAGYVGTGVGVGGAGFPKISCDERQEISHNMPQEISQHIIQSSFASKSFWC